MAEAKAKPKARKKYRPREEFAIYVVELLEWDWSFSFGTSYNPKRDGPYADYRHLDFKGRLLSPSRIKTKAIDLTFIPSQSLNESHRAHDQPRNIGALSVHGGPMMGLFSMPADALPSLLTMATAGRLRYLIIQGDKLRYGQGSMKNYRFETNLNPDDVTLE